MELPYDPSIPLLSIFKGTQNTNSKEYMHPYVHCSIIYNRQYMDATQVPINRCVDKEVVVHIYNGILLGYIKEILPFETAEMDLEGTMLNKICQSEKDQYHIISLICGI